ncbi:MAG: hypothetical protein N2510_05230 [Ignavibacteria bacterium]|nr:hypothetical protein [Ignavibacteria bacterium]
MRRYHFAETEDKKWLPGSIRSYMVDYLRFMGEILDVYRPSYEIIRKLCRETGERKITDLCSGGGGISLRLAEELKDEIDSIVLSDLYPNTDSFRYLASRNSKISFITEPVDARDVPDSLKGIRTIYSSIPHFSPDEVKDIFRSSFTSSNPIAVFEAAERKISHLLVILIFTPILFFLFTPFIRPFRFGRLFFTYVFPVVPVLTTFDGIVSVLRMYKSEELLTLAKESVPEYRWEGGCIRDGMRKVNYVTGRAV